ncbi:uncharacterized protein LOC111049409 isoform X2 [Nilaparvata lugens]|uniref:uncharacterized protein LOC111049409 isoform X2 n=1 Tax=Nilaparvata lugens TaxID=108931 RepID=UPI00193C951B|nr:uncharacterized protein LOC111049409 isoform X2 [Nilaparvata lugens]
MAPRKKRKPSQAENIKILEQLIIDKDKIIIDKDESIANLDRKLKKKDSLISDYKKLCVLTDYNLNRSVSDFDGAQRMVNFAQHVTYLKNTLEARCDSLNEKVNALESELAYKERVIEKCELEIKQYTAMNDEFKITVEDLKNDQIKTKSDCQRLEEKVLQATKWAARLGKVIKEREIPLCKSDARLLGQIQKQLKQKGSVLKESDGDQLHESEMLKHSGTQTDESALNSMIYKNYRKVAAYTDGLGVLSPCLTADEGIGLSPGLSEISLATPCSNYKDNFQSYGPLHKEPTSVDDGSITTEIIEDSLDHSPATPAFSLFDVQVGSTRATISIGPQLTNDNILNGSSANWPSIDTLNLSNCSVESVKDDIFTAHLNDNDDIAKNDNLVTIEEDLDVSAKSKSDTIVTIEEDVDESAKCNGLVSSYIFQEGDKTYKMLKYRDHCKIVLPHEVPRLLDGQIQNSDGKSVEICDRLKNNVEAFSGANGKFEECITGKNLKKTLEEVVPVCQESNKLDKVTELFSPMIDKNWYVDPISGEVSPIREKSDKLVESPPVTEVFSSSSSLPSSPAKRNGSVSSYIFQDGDNTYKMLKYKDHCKIVLTHEEPQNSDGKNVEICDGLKFNVEASNSTHEECITEKNRKETLEEVIDEVALATEVFSTASPMIDEHLNVNPVSETVEEVVLICEKSDKLDEVIEVISTESPMIDKKLDVNPMSETLEEVVPICQKSDKLDEVIEVFSTDSPMIDENLDVNPVSETVEVVSICEKSNKLDEVIEVFSPESAMIDENLNVNPVSETVEVVSICEKSNKLDEAPLVTGMFSNQSPMIDKKLYVNPVSGILEEVAPIREESDKVVEESPMIDKKLYVNPVSGILEEVVLICEESDKLDEESPMIDKKLYVNPVSGILEEVVPICEESDKLDEITGEFSAMIKDKVAVNHENDEVEDCNKRVVCEQVNLSNNINDHLENDCNVSFIVEVNDSCLEEINALQNDSSIDNKCADLQPGDGENISGDNLITEMTTGLDNKCADLQPEYEENISEHDLKTEMTVGEDDIFEEGNKTLHTIVSSYDKEQSSPLPPPLEHKVGEIAEEEIESMYSEAMQLESTEQSSGSSCASFDPIHDEDNAAIDLSINVENVNNAQINSETPKIEENPLTSISSISIGNNLRENDGCKTNFTTESKSIENNMSCMESNQDAGMPLDLSLRQSNPTLLKTPTPPRKSIFDNLENVTDLNNPPTNLNIHHKSLHFGDELQGTEQRSMICGTKQFKMPLPVKQVEDLDNASKHKDSNRKIPVVEDEVLDKIMRRMQMKSILKGPLISPIPPSPQTFKQGPSIQMELSMLSSAGEKSFAAPDPVGSSSYSIRKEEISTTKSDVSRNAHHTKQETIITLPKCTEGTSLRNVSSSNTSKCNLKTISKRDHVGNSSYSIHKEEMPSTKSDESRNAHHTKQDREPGFNGIPSRIRSHREEESKSSTSEKTANEASCIDAVRLEDVKPTLKYSSPNVSNVAEFDIDKLLAEIRRDFDVPDCIDDFSDSVSISDIRDLDCEEVSDFENMLVSSILSDELPPANTQSEIQFPDVIIAEKIQSPPCEMEEDICEEQTSVLSTTLIDQHANKSEVDEGFSKATENAASLLADIPKATENAASLLADIPKATENAESLLADNPTETSPGFSKICTNGNKILPDSAQSCNGRAQCSDSTILFQGIENQESRSLENSDGSFAVPDKVSKSDESDFRGSLPNEPMISDPIYTGHEGEQNTNQSILANEQSTLNSSRENCEYSKLSDELIGMDTAQHSYEGVLGTNNVIPANRLEACSLKSSETNFEYPPASKNLSESDGSDFKGFATVNSSDKPVGNSTVSENLVDPGESVIENWTSSSKSLENASVPKLLSDPDESDFKGWASTSDKRIENPPVSKNLADSDESDFKGWACTSNTSDKRIENPPVSKNLADSDESDFKGWACTSNTSDKRIENPPVSKILSDSDESDFKGWDCTSNTSDKLIENPPVSKNLSDSYESDFKGWDCTSNTSDKRIENPPVSKILSDSDESDFKGWACTSNTSDKLIENPPVSKNLSDKSDFKGFSPQVEKIEAVQLDYGRTTPPDQHCKKEKTTMISSNSILIQKTRIIQSPTRSSFRLEQMEKCNKFVCRTCSVDDKCNLLNYSKKRICESPIAANEPLSPAKVTKTRETSLTRQNKTPYMRSKSVPKDFSYMVTRSGKRILRAGSEEKSSPSYKREIPEDNLSLERIPNIDEVDTNGYKNALKSRNVNPRGRPIHRRSHPFYNSRRTSLQFNNDEVNSLREHKDESEPLVVENHRNLSNYSEKRIFETSIAENEILSPAKVTTSKKAILPRNDEACSPIITRSKSVPKDFSYMLTRSGKRILKPGSGDADQIEAKSSPSNRKDVSEDNLDEVDTISSEKRECEVANGYRNSLKSRNVNTRGRPIRRSSHPFYNSRRRFSQFDEVNTLREHNDESEPMIVENDRNLSVGRLHDENAACERSSVIKECESEHLSSCFSTGKTNESEKRPCLFVDCVNDSLQDSPLSPIDDEDLNDYDHFKQNSEEFLSTDSINTMETNITVNVSHDHSNFGGALQIDCQENDEIPHKNYCEVENGGEFSSSNCYENDISSLKTCQRHIPVISIEHRKSLRRIPRTTSTITSQAPATDTESSLEIDLPETSTAPEPSIGKVITFNFYSEVSEATQKSSNKRKSDDSESLNLQPKIRKIEEDLSSQTISSHPVDAENPDAPKCVKEKIKMVRCENVIVTAYDYHRKDLFKGYSKLDQSNPEEESEEDSEVAEYVFTRVARAVLENNVADETDTCDDSEDSEECEPWTVEVVTECLEQLRGIPNNVIANLIVDTLYNDEGEVDLDGPAPLTDLQKKVLTISCKLCADTVNHPHFLQSLLSELRRFLLNYEESETVTRYCLYVRFLTILCRIHSEVEEMRSFIYDALYRKKMAGIPMVYTALIMWPPLLPFAQPLETASPLSLGITQVILNHIMRDHNQVYKIRKIEHILRKYYGYSRLEPIEVFKHLMRRINTEGALEAVALLCKKIGPHWTVKFVVEGTLLPILNEYKLNKNNSAAAINAMRVSSYVLRPLLQGRYTGKLNLVMGTIGTLLTDPEADDMIEAVAAESLCRLSRGNMKLCAELLIKWKPRNGKVSLQLIELMKVFIARLKPVRWLELMTENNLIKAQGQKSQ